MLTPSIRRVYTSRAFSIAMRASAACKLPTCLWSSPCLLRIKTSHKGHSALSLDISLFSFISLTFFLMGHRGFPHPSPFIMRPGSAFQSLPITGSPAFNDPPKLLPVNFSKIIVSPLRIPFQVRIGYLQPQIFSLWHRNIHKTLPQFVIGKPLNFPLHGPLGIRRILIFRTKHHQRRPPPTI